MNIFPPRNLSRTGANASVSAAPASSTSSSAQHVPKASRNRTPKWLSYFFKPIIATLVYFVTLYVSASAPFRHALLGRVSAPLGNWFLTILAKAGDISFAFAVEDSIDTLTWRRLKERTKIAGSGNFNGIRLEWFLALLSTTGVEGLFGVLRRSMRHGFLRNTAGRWSFIRLAFILVLIPGPGIILMASVPQRDVIFPVRTVDVSGGVAMYDPQLATIYRPAAGIYAWRYVQTMLQDRSLTWPVDPISKACKSNNTCKSYLLAGSSETVGPWPFAIEANGNSFQLRDAPVYQVELWEPAPQTLVFSESRDCTLYGGLDPKKDYSMEVCIALQSNDGVLAAGWQGCAMGYAPNGTCLVPINDVGWATYLRFFRRKATITFSRQDNNIQDVRLLSSPTPQQILPKDLFSAINNILYQPSHLNESQNNRQYELLSSQFILTQQIATILYQTIADPNARALSYGRDWLRNILTLPVYLFQPTRLAYGNQSVSADNLSYVAQPNLPAENYFKGQYCIVDHRAIPSWGVVLGYAIVAGMLLFFVWAGKAIAWHWPEVETTNYPLLDVQVLTKLVVEGPIPPGHPVPEVSLRERFAGREYRDIKILEETKDLRIGLRTL